MVRVERRGFVILAVAADVVLEHGQDAERAVHRPADILRDAQAEARGQDPAQVVGFTVVETPGLRMIEAVSGPVAEHVVLDVPPPGEAGDDGRPVEGGRAVDTIVMVDEPDEDPRDLVPGPVEAAARRVRRVIPGALVAGGIDGGHGVEDEGRLGGESLVPRQRVGRGERFGAVERELFDDPGVVRADEIMDAAVRSFPPRPGVGMGRVRQDVAVVAGHRPGTVERGARLVPDPPGGAADRTAREAVGETGAPAGHLGQQPGVVARGPGLRRPDDAAADFLRPGEAPHVFAGASDIGRSHVDGRMDGGSTRLALGLRRGGAGRRSQQENQRDGGESMDHDGTSGTANIPRPGCRSF